MAEVSVGGAPIPQTQGQGLATKESVDYRQGDQLSRCGICSNFVPPDQCGLVEGPVAAQMLCNLYAPLDAGKQTPGAPLPLPLGPAAPGPAGLPTGGAPAADIMTQLFGG